MPTTEFSSPTATSAVNEKRRPPLTTLATRLISITRSCRSSPWGLTVSMSWFTRKSKQGSGSESPAAASPPDVPVRRQSRRPSELQSTLAGALGGPADLGSHSPAPPEPALWLGMDGHARLPTFRLTCSPAYLTPLPL